VGRRYDQKIIAKEVWVLKIEISKDIKNLIFRFRDDDVMALAAQLAYSLLLAFFPFLIFLMTLVGHSSIKSSDVLIGLNQILPTNAFELIRSTVVEVVDTKNSNLLSVSLIFTIWTASSGFMAVMKGLNKAYDESEGRSIFKVELIAVLCTLGLTFIIILTLVLLVLGEIIGNNIALRVGYPEQFKMIWDIFRYFIILCSMVYVFAGLYHYTPCRRLTWREVFPGALFATAGWVIASIGFSFYVNNFNNYSRVYGSIGVVIILLTWLFLTSVIIIMGGELNATLAFDRDGKEKPTGKKF